MKKKKTKVQHKPRPHNTTNDGAHTILDAVKQGSLFKKPKPSTEKFVSKGDTVN